ncbi:MAG: aconitate hydratase B, partial [Deltaproteobacteria bacterium]
MLDAYLQQEKKRNSQGIPALPLIPEQTTQLCDLLRKPPAGREDLLLHLFRERIAPGVDPSAKIKADFLGDLLQGKAASPLIDRKEAIRILGTMIGGYNVPYLITALQEADLADEAAGALSGITLVYDAFNEVLELSKSNPAARKVIESWAAADWFTSRPELPTTFTL